MIWSYLIHLGTHMWADKDGMLYGRSETPRGLMDKAEDKLRCNKEEWIALTNAVAEMGVAGKLDHPAYRCGDLVCSLPCYKCGSLAICKMECFPLSICFLQCWF